MLRMECMRDAVEGVTTAALLGEGWEEALHRFAYASGAHGAVLMRNRSSRMLSAITTEEVAETVSAFAAGRAPPSSRYLVVRVGPKIGFRVDHDDYNQDQLNRDPYYQEFLRPAGFFWHANAALTFDREEWVELLQPQAAHPLRPLSEGGRDCAQFCLAAIARGGPARDTNAQQRGDRRVNSAAEPLGDSLYQLDSGGRVLSTDALDGVNRADHPISVIGRRLRSRDASVQLTLDRAVAIAVARPGVTTLAPLTGDNTRRYFLQIVPVPGRARDIFYSAAAIAVLIDVRNPPRHRRLHPSTIREALALTDREADVACLLAEGMALTDVASRLRMQPSTARVHFRSAARKNRHEAASRARGFPRIPSAMTFGTAARSTVAAPSSRCAARDDTISSMWVSLVEVDLRVASRGGMRPMRALNPIRESKAGDHGRRFLLRESFPYYHSALAAKPQPDRLAQSHGHAGAPVRCGFAQP